MKTKTNNLNFNASIIAASLRRLAISRLNKKQRLALEIIKENGFDSNATRLIEFLATRLQCSSSTVWNVLRSLAKHGLIKCGTKENKGIKLSLTKLGEFLTGANK
jgi:DNA-binding MarR family transcriptional regulator